MKYLIIGAGGTGGTLGFYMTKAQKDVTLIARNKHLATMKSNGLTLETLWDSKKETISVNAVSMEEYKENPDVILVCVKGYSLDSVIPFIQRVAKPSTIVIPILNIYGTGGRMQKQLPNLSVMDGCIYVSANISSYGTILQHGKILRVVYGARTPKEFRPELREIQRDFSDSAIDGILSDQIKRDTLKKFSYVSPIGAAGLYFQATAGDFQKEGEPREMFKAMIREISALAEAMNIPFEQDYVAINLDILSALPPETTTSMQRDVMAQKASEIDGLIFEVVRMGKQYHVPVPMYEKVAEKLKDLK